MAGNSTLESLVTSPIIVRLPGDPTHQHRPGVLERVILGTLNDTPVTQEIPRGLGALFQELGPRPNVVLPMMQKGRALPEPWQGPGQLLHLAGLLPIYNLKYFP